MLKRMYKVENEMRNSNFYQSQFDRNGDRYDDVIDQLQIELLNRFGFKNISKNNNGIGDLLEMYRRTVGVYRDDKELIGIPLYSRYNRTQAGNIKIGEIGKDVKLWRNEKNNNDLQLTSLYEESSGSDLMIIIAGSIT